MKGLLKKINKKLLLFTLLGAFIGIVAFVGTTSTLKATDTAEFCASCHVYESTVTHFQESNHANLKCNDCHTPNDSMLAKYTYKAKSALGHGYMYTVGTDKIPNVIHASAKSKEVVEQNCISCHEPGLENIEHDAKDSCVDCHRQVPHGKGNFKTSDWYEPQNYDFND